MALAIEAGRKAAWWVVEEKQELFKHKVADPLIKVHFFIAVIISLNLVKAN